MIESRAVRFRTWLTAECGLSKQTAYHYSHYVHTLLSSTVGHTAAAFQAYLEGHPEAGRIKTAWIRFVAFNQTETPPDALIANIGCEWARSAATVIPSPIATHATNSTIVLDPMIDIARKAMRAKYFDYRNKADRAVFLSKLTWPRALSLRNTGFSQNGLIALELLPNSSWQLSPTVFDQLWKIGYPTRGIILDWMNEQLPDVPLFAIDEIGASPEQILKWSRLHVKR